MESGGTNRRFRLTGERFAGGRLPVDSLIELERYQNAVRIMAEHQWKSDHPDEQLPEDFAKGVSLAIERIDEGSADILLAFEQHAIYEVYQAEARDSVEATIDAAYAGKSLPQLPEEVGETVRNELAALGSSLSSGQAIELYSHGPDATPVRIDVVSRELAAERLILADFLSTEAPPEKPALVKDEGSLVARVIAVNAETTRFELESPQHGKLHGWYRQETHLLKDLRAVLNSASQGPLIRVHGELQTKGGLPMRFWTTSKVETVEFDDTDWGRTLRHLTSLPAGWAGGAGEQISSVALDAAQALLRMVDVAARPPALAPTEEGGVLIEWITSDGIVSVEILEDGLFELFAMGANEVRGSQSETRDVSEAAAFADGGIA